MPHEPSETEGYLPEEAYPKTSSADVGRGPAKPGSTNARHGETSPPSSYDFLTPPQQPDEIGRLGPFRILRELGKGGMGVVFEAEETSLRRRVALKVMLRKVAENPTAKARFIREARAQAMIESDHVIAIHRVDEDHGVPYIAMPMLQGQMLADALKANPRPPVDIVLRVGREMAEGLAAAHEKGLIHRDIKPGNVWLESPKLRVKILDFGLARAGEGTEGEDSEDVTVTKQGQIVGTPAYMSPEQARAAPLDYRTDLFSLGVVLYEMATGARPFQGKDVFSIMTALAIDVPVPPSEKNPAVPASLSNLILALLEKDPTRRPASARAVADDLQRIADSSQRKVILSVAAPVQVVNDPWADIDVEDSRTVVTPPSRAARTPEAKGPPWLWIGGGVGAVAAVGVVLALTLGGGKPKPKEVASVTPPAATPKKVDPPKKESPKTLVPPPADPPVKVEPNPAEVAAMAELDAAAKKSQAEWAMKVGQPVEQANSLGMTMVLLPPAPGSDQPLRVSKYEVTQSEWQAVLKYNPSEFQLGKEKVLGLDTSRFPVEKVTWFDCIEFCNKLSEKEDLPPYYELKVEERKILSIEKAEVKVLGGKGYHLPTDVEWTWLCAASGKKNFHFGSDEGRLSDYGWYQVNSDGRTHAVGELAPNAWGLYDTHGNVREWVEDTYTKAETGAPERVSRGGYWSYTAANCAVSYRYRHAPAYRSSIIGLRLVRVP